VLPINLFGGIIKDVEVAKLEVETFEDKESLFK
jgi:hypothetical protein